MEESYKLIMPTKFFLGIPGCLVLPPLGGVVEMASLKPGSFDLLHIFCIFPYIAFAIWLARYLQRRIELSNEHISVYGWLRFNEYKFDEIKVIAEVIMPAQNHMTGRYDYMPHLYIVGPESTDLVRGFYIRKYPELKLAIEKIIGKNLETIQIEKSRILKTFEMLDLLGGSK